MTTRSSPLLRKRKHRQNTTSDANAPPLTTSGVVQVDLTREPPVAPDDKKIHERRLLPLVPAKRAGRPPKK